MKMLNSSWLRLCRDGRVVLSCSPALVARPAARRRLSEAVSEQLGVPCHPVGQPGSVTVVFHRLRLPDRVSPAGDLPIGVVDLGVSAFGHPVRVQLAEPRSAHMLIVGATGTGESTILREILVQARRWARVIVIDSKREYGDVADHPRVDRHVEYEAVATAIRQARQTMNDRYVQRERGEDVGEPLLIMIDEAAELRALAAEKQGKNPPIFGDLSSILRLGRAARVHAIVGIQRPDLAELPLLSPGAARDNVGIKIGCGRLSQSGSEMIFFNAPAAAARELTGPPGRAVIETGSWWGVAQLRGPATAKAWEVDVSRVIRTAELLLRRSRRARTRS